MKRGRESERERYLNESEGRRMRKKIKNYKDINRKRAREKESKEETDKETDRDKERQRRIER